ncbi:hypothetical protein QR685DRAFT_574493 [Neurospora intermedia]|uniref:Uncharacterized protein n=1 Tax=Neurospora intermedia TaxID=5142 RepID=A0ABR3D503_NEUIN
MACSVWVTSLRGSETWEGGETSGVGDLFGAGQHKGRKDGWRIKTAGSRDPERQQQQQQQQAVGQQLGQGVEVVRNGCHGHGKGRYKEWTGAEIMEDVLRALPELRDKSTRRRTGSDRPFLALTEVRVQVLSWREKKEESAGRRKVGRTRAASHDGDTWSLSLATIGVVRPGRKRKRRRRRRRRRPGRRARHHHCSISFRLSVTYLPPESALERSVHATMFDATAKHMKVRMVGGQCSWIFHPCR